MGRPDPFPPLRSSSEDASRTVASRRKEGAALFSGETRYTRDLQDRFEAWFQGTAKDLELMFWSMDVANWFREGTCWLVGSCDYRGMMETRDDRLVVLDEILGQVGDSTLKTSETIYDVSLSFAGEQRQYVERVAGALRAAGVRVFYDGYEEVNLWGRNLYDHLNEIYRDRSKYCVIFVSKEYAAKQWTSHERQSAQARAFRENREYILPVRFDDTEVPGLNETVGYIDLRRTEPERLAELIVDKLARTRNVRSAFARPRSWDSRASTPDPADADVENLRASRSARHPTSTDKLGFLTLDAVVELVLARSFAQEKPVARPLLLYENQFQKTWLVVTQHTASCILDDRTKGPDYDPLRWSEAIEDVLPVKVRSNTPVAGLVDFGPRHNDWLYSRHLYPNGQVLARTLRALLKSKKR